MSIAEIIKTECKSRKIPVSRLERDLGFCNGYVRGLKDKIPLDRAKEISEYLHIPLSTLMEDETISINDGHYIDPEVIALSHEMATRPELAVLISSAKTLDKEDLDFINQTIEHMKKKY